MEDLLKNPLTFFTHITGFPPFVYQAEFLKMEEKRIAMRSGRQIGKTVVAAVRALYQAYTYPNQVILIIAPTLRQAGILIKNIKTYVSTNIDLFVLEEPKKDRKKQLPKNTATEMWFENGSQIYCLPSGKQSGDNIRGFSPHLIIVDEAAFVSEDAFSAIEPSLASTNGDLILISTPYGQRGFFYDSFRPDTEYKTMHVKSEQCPNITEEFLRSRRNDPRITENEYIREYEGEFTSAADNMFRREDLKFCMDIEHQTNLPEDGHIYEMGVDVARFGEDETVFTIADLTDNRVVFIDFSGKEKITQTQTRIEKLHAIWNFQQINVDASSFGGGIVDSLGDKGYPVYGFPFHRIREKANLYENLQRLIQDHKINILKHRKLWTQMTDLVFTETAQGRSIQPSSKKRHDDFADSLALACMTMKSGGLDEDKLEWRSS